MMGGAWPFLLAHWRRIGAVLLALALLPPATSALFSGASELTLVASAPAQGETMQVALSGQSGLLRPCDGEARVEVLRDDFIVYSSALGRMSVDGCRGSIEIPYAQFASANGVYTVRAEFQGQTTAVPVNVQKVVNWVYVRSFPQPEEERSRIDVALDAAKNQPLTSSIFASGDLVLDIRWEECADEGPLPSLDLTGSNRCEAKRQHVFHAEIPVESEASTHIFIPWKNLASDTDDDGRPEEGWYNVTATFHNDVAKGNDNVPMDPTLFHEDPPATWFEVSYD